MYKFLLPFFLLPMCLSAQSQAPLRVMSFNIRLNTPNDGYNGWPHRRQMVESMIRYHQADVIGVQEALQGQMDDLTEMLPDFASHGVARDTGKWAEYSAIWYRTSRLELLEGKTFWLSETPDQMSQGWDAALNRIATWAIFRDKWTDKRFFHLNTHFDHRGQKARRESARLILKQLQILNPDKLPVLVTGDFNANPESEPYQVLTQSKDLTVVQDAWHLGQLAAHGPNSTWSGFAFPGVPERRIDYVFVQNDVLVRSVASLSDSWSGRFPSDHLPMIAEVLIDPVKALPNAHAHNDYEHDRPLFDALDHGFTSVEADVWLLEGELYVSHNKPKSLSPDKTLRALYLDPLARRVSENMGAVHPGMDVSFSLMIDLKNEGEAAYQVIQNQLQAYRWMLEGRHRKPAPLMIFLSGARPVMTMQADKNRLVGIDGRPEHLGEGFSAEEMPVISQRYGKIISWRGGSEIPAEDLATLQSLAARSHAEGKRVRLWASPEKEEVWKVLQEVGIDLINTDELARLQRYLEENK